MFLSSHWLEFFCADEAETIFLTPRISIAIVDDGPGPPLVFWMLNDRLVSILKVAGEA
jgi:hypothetical protein